MPPTTLNSEEPVCLSGTTHRIPAGERNEGGGAAWLRPPRRVRVRTTGSLVAAEVGHGLVQARAADAHERQGDELSMNSARGGVLRC